jgi:hypothetical protein
MDRRPGAEETAMTYDTDELLETLAEPRPTEADLNPPLLRDSTGAVLGIDWERLIEEGLIK